MFFALAPMWLCTLLWCQYVHKATGWPCDNYWWLQLPYFILYDLSSFYWDGLRFRHEKEAKPTQPLLTFSNIISTVCKITYWDWSFKCATFRKEGFAYNSPVHDSECQARFIHPRPKDPIGSLIIIKRSRVLFWPSRDPLNGYIFSSFVSYPGNGCMHERVESTRYYPTPHEIEQARLPCASAFFVTCSSLIKITIQ